MRFSNLLGKRMKEVPADNFFESHIVMVKGGYIKNMSSGIFSLFSPAKRVINKIENILRVEMDEIGGQEVLFPVAMPANIWEESGRYDTIGGEMIRFNDRNERKMVLGMTHEEAAVHLAKNVATSYLDYPFMIYQIQTKFRDELRPRGGLIRTREFIMKDAYSFHTSVDDMKEYYKLCHSAYERIFRKVGLPDVISVESDSGMMGGEISHEFMLLSESGEDKIVICKNCGYKANVESLFSGSENNVRGLEVEDVSKILVDCECPKCKKKDMTVTKGIEIGNIFQLGQKYTESMGMTYVDSNNKRQFPHMACYGIGVGRLLAAICEAHHDEHGPIWPISVAPWELEICAIGINNDKVKETAEKIYAECKKESIDVIFDDRNVHAGEMLFDSDLIGAPIRLIVSEKNLKRNKIEISTRDKKFKDFVELEEAINVVKKLAGC